MVADVVDEQVEAIIRALRLPDDWQAEIESQLDRAADIQTLKNKRQRLQAEMKRLRALPAGQLVASQVTVGELIATRGEGNTVKARYKR